LTLEQGGGSPDTDAIRARSPISVSSCLCRLAHPHPRWLAGARLTYADLAAAAHLSSVDYLAMCRGTKTTREGLVRAGEVAPVIPAAAREAHAGIPPSKTYADLDSE